MFHDKLKRLRKQHGITQAGLASILGFSQQAVASWEMGRSFPDEKTLPRIAQYFRVSLDELLDCPLPPSSQTVRIPILSSIIAGVSLESIKNIDGEEEIPQHMAAQGEFFALRVKDPSMEPFMNEGDVVIVKRQADCASGEIALVNVAGAEAALKKVQKTPNGMTLIAYNPSVYEPHFYSMKDIRTLPVTIFGVVVELRRRFSPAGFRHE